MSDAPRLLFLDIETAPNLAYVWAKYEQNVIAYEQETFMLAVSWKWYGRRANALTLYDLPGGDPTDDSALVQVALDLLDEADIVVGHNLDRFDIRKINAYALVNGLTPPSPYRTIDTLKVARRHFMFNDNKLGALCKRLDLPVQKGDPGGFGTWLGCLRDDPKAWKRMKRYAKGDVEVLEPLYERLRPWVSNHPSMSYSGALECARCGSESIQKRGLKRTQTAVYQCYQCNDCSGYSRSRVSEPKRAAGLVSA